MLRNALKSVVTAAVLLMPTVGAAQMTIEERFAPGQPPVVLAKRAKGFGNPDNSLAGIQNAIDRGVDMVELSLQPTLDGQYIMVRETRLTDITNVADVYPDGAPSLAGSTLARRNLTSDYTLEEISHLKMKDPYGGNHPVPDLDTVMEMTKGRIMIEMFLRRWDVDTLASALSRHDTSGIVLFAERQDDSKLAETAKLTGIGVMTYLNFGDPVIQFEKDLEKFGQHLALVMATNTHLTPQLEELARYHGVPIVTNGAAYQDEDAAYKAGDLGPWREVLKNGTQGFRTKFPDEVLTLLGR